MGFDAADLQKKLAHRPAQVIDSVASTQDLALAWLADGAPDGAVVIADEQRAGRGRHGRTWYTPPGVALAVSVVLKPERRALPQVTMIGALAIVDVLDALGAQTVGIKWPNDVLLDSRKVSGVLPEADWQGDRLRGVALGIGINVRVQFDDPDLAGRAISIEPALGKPIDRSELLVKLLDRLDAWHHRLGEDAVFAAWRSRLVTIGTRVQVGQVVGEAVDVTADGGLVIAAANGARKTVFAGELHAGDGGA